MENNQNFVQRSQALHEGAAALVRRCAEMARIMLEKDLGEGALTRGGRKGHQLDARAQLQGPDSRSDTWALIEVQTTTCRRLPFAAGEPVFPAKSEITRRRPGAQR